MMPKASNRHNPFPREKGHEKNVLFLNIYVKSITTYIVPNSHYWFLGAILKIEKQSARGKKRFFLVFFGKTNSLRSFIFDLLNINNEWI